MTAQHRISTPHVPAFLIIATEAISLLASPLVHAQEESPIEACPRQSDGCHEAPVDFHFQEGFFDSVMFDSGWVPADSPVQVRFAVRGGGETEVDLAGTSLTFWPSPLSTAIVGTPSSGRLSIDYGLEVVARIRVDVEVAGVRYAWEGDIPGGGSVPRDLRLAAMTTFDSMLLPEAAAVSAQDTTDPYRVYETGLAGLSGIPGWLSGALTVDAEAHLAVDYRTTHVEIGEAPRPIELEGGVASVLPDRGAIAFGAAKDVVIGPVGQIDYEGAIRVYPGLYIEVAGRRFDVALSPVDMPILRLDRAARFGEVVVHVPLPDVAVDSATLDFGEVPFGESAMQSIEFRNEGEAELEIRPRPPGRAFSYDSEPFVIAPHSSRRFEMTFSPMGPSDSSGMLFFETNDPDESLVGIRLSALSDEMPGDGGIGDGGAAPRRRADCACGIAGLRSSALVYPFGMALMLVMALRRRRTLM